MALCANYRADRQGVFGWPTRRYRGGSRLPGNIRFDAGKLLPLTSYGHVVPRK